MIEIDYSPGKRKCVFKTDEDTLTYVRNHFSVKNDGAYFARKKGVRFVADRFYAITPTGLFDFGMVNEIRKFLIENQITDITYSEKFKQTFKENKITDDGVWDNLKFDARYYQRETIEQCLKVGCGTVILGTGAGKSLTQALLVENYKRNVPHETFKCLIIVPGLSLVSQLCSDFKDYGVTFTYSPWTGDDPLQDTQVVVCNSENLLAKYKEHPWVMNVDIVIQDECHKIKKSNEVSKIVGKIKTLHKFGFTGTLSEVLIDQWKTIGTFGPILYEKKSKELRDEGFLVNVKCYGVTFNHRKGKMNYRQEEEYLINHEVRNGYIAKIAGKLQGNTLIMVNRLGHMDNLRDLLPNAKFVSGEVPVEERTEIIKEMENGDGVITVAMSSIFSTGINVKNLHNIILTYGGKSFIRLVQSVGRGLRLHDTKNILTIIDCRDNLKYSTNHSIERERIYDKEAIPFRNSKAIDI